MTTTETVLLVILIVLTFVLLSGKSFGDLFGHGKQNVIMMPLNAAVNEVSSLTKNAKPKPDKTTYEDKAYKALNEQMEYFQACSDPDEIKKLTECVCEGQDTFSFAQNDYGAPGLDYKTFVTSQAVSEDVIKNHSQYVSDRDKLTSNGSGAYFTGRTMSPDSHDSYDPVPWVGLRRPQAVEQCNPTQVPDIDINLFKGNRQFCFKT